MPLSLGQWQSHCLASANHCKSCSQGMQLHVSNAVANCCGCESMGSFCSITPLHAAWISSSHSEFPSLSTTDNRNIWMSFLRNRGVASNFAGMVCVDRMNCRYKLHLWRYDMQIPLQWQILEVRLSLAVAWAWASYFHFLSRTLTLSRASLTLWELIWKVMLFSNLGGEEKD